MEASPLLCQNNARIRVSMCRVRCVSASNIHDSRVIHSLFCVEIGGGGGGDVVVVFHAICVWSDLIAFALHAQRTRLQPSSYTPTISHMVYMQILYKHYSFTLRNCCQSKLTAMHSMIEMEFKGEQINRMKWQIFSSRSAYSQSVKFELKQIIITNPAKASGSFICVSFSASKPFRIQFRHWFLWSDGQWTVASGQWPVRSLHFKLFIDQLWLVKAYYIPVNSHQTNGINWNFVWQIYSNFERSAYI